MNNIIFKKIILDSFLSYDHEELEINQSGVVFIKGENNQDSKSESNGSGKSALISESLLWCLTGYTSRNADEVKNIYLDRGASVTVHLDKNGVEYIITRGTLNSNANNGLTVIKNGENVTKARILDTKEWFETEFPELSWSVLTSIVILSQGLIGGLSTMVNRDRKAKLEELSKVDITYNSVKSLTDSVQQRFETKLLYLKQKVSVNTVQSQVNSRMIDSIQLNISAIEEDNLHLSNTEWIDKEVASLRKTYSELELSKIHNEEQSSIKHGVLNKLNEELEIANREYTLRAKQYDAVSNNQRNTKSEILNKFSEIENNKHELSHIVDKECPTCHQVVDSSLTDELKQSLNESIIVSQKEMDDTTLKYNKIVEEFSALSLLIVTLESDVKQLQRRISEEKELIEQYDSSYKTINQSLLKLNSQIIELIQRKNTPMENTDTYKSNIVKLFDENKVLESELNSFLREQSELENKLNIAKWFSSQTSKALRSYMLEGVIDYINSRCKEYSEYLFDSEIVYLKSDGSTLDIFLGNKKIENCSGGEHRRVDIILQLSIRDLVMNETGFSSNLLIIDEVFDHLDSLGISTVLDLITSQKQTISSIFLITHKNDADIDYDNILIVRKENNISRVIQ